MTGWPRSRQGAIRTAWRGRAWYVLAVLFLVGVCSLMDRHVLAILLEPIRSELGVSDAAMGLLTGSAFVFFYSIAGLPIARLADRHSRRDIIAAGLAIWSLMTCLSGLATSFWYLTLARVGVGVGEATYNPPSGSMLSDYFPPARRAVAFSVLAVSTQVGIMASLLMGGWLAASVGWRMTLVLIGLPGVLLALLVRLTVAEPVRGGVEAEGADVTLYDLRTTVSYLWHQRSFRHLTAAATLALFAMSALIVWSPTFLMRVHEMDVMQAAASLGLPTGIGGASGVLLGGFVAERLLRRDARWLLWVPALAELLGLPFVVAFLFLPSRAAAVAMFAGAALCGPAMLGPAMTTCQGLARVRMRALAGAIIGLTTNLVGLGLGPLLVGALSDRLRPSLGDSSLRYALLPVAAAMLGSGLHFLAGARHLRGDLARSAR